jgi:hypothetical protein
MLAPLPIDCILHQWTVEQSHNFDVNLFEMSDVYSHVLVWLIETNNILVQLFMSVVKKSKTLHKLFGSHSTGNILRLVHSLGYDIAKVSLDLTTYDQARTYCQLVPSSKWNIQVLLKCTSQSSDYQMFDDLFSYRNQYDETVLINDILTAGNYDMLYHAWRHGLRIPSTLMSTLHSQNRLTVTMIHNLMPYGMDVVTNNILTHALIKEERAIVKALMEYPNYPLVQSDLVAASSHDIECFETMLQLGLKPSEATYIRIIDTENIKAVKLLFKYGHRNVNNRVLEVIGIEYRPKVFEMTKLLLKNSIKPRNDDLLFALVYYQRWNLWDLYIKRYHRPIKEYFNIIRMFEELCNSIRDALPNSEKLLVETFARMNRFITKTKIRRLPPDAECNICYNVIDDMYATCGNSDHYVCNDCIHKYEKDVVCVMCTRPLIPQYYRVK